MTPKPPEPKLEWKLQLMGNKSKNEGQMAPARKIKSTLKVFSQKM